MKKIATILVLLFVLSVSAFAEGDVPIGGRSCPQGQACRANDDTTENPIIKIFDFLKSIFE